MTTDEAVRDQQQPTFNWALSWSLRIHYTENLAATPYGPGREGTAACSGNTKVYDKERLGHYHFDPRVLDKDHPTCKICTKKAGRKGTSR